MGPPLGIASIEIAPGAALITEVGGMVLFTADVRDASGQALSLAGLEWSVLDPAVASVNGLSRRVTGLAPGRTSLVVRSGAVADTSSLEVYVDPNGGPFLAGTQYFGRESYIEYEPGELPLVLSSPHGGYLDPAEIDERTFGVVGQDLRTQEVTRALADAIEARSGRRPHMIISLLHRRRLDPNREIVEAAQGNVFAEQAWAEFHGFIETASAAAADQFGTALYLDMHGHGHAIQRLEMGYRLTSADLERPDNLLDQQVLIAKTSFRRLVDDASASFPELVRGPTSLGGLLVTGGYPAVPSPDAPDPGGNPYFTGGYDVDQHGSSDGGPVSGIQIEMNFTGVRQTEADRLAFTAALAEALEQFLLIHYGYDWTVGG